VRNLLLVGRIARAHGNKGQVIVNPETDFAEARFRVGEILLVGPEDRAQPRRILEVRFHQGRPIIALDGVETMNDAEALAGEDLRMPSSAMDPLPEGTFYRHDLVGCEVRDTAGALVGRVAAVDGAMQQSHLVVERPDGDRGEILIPLAAEICVGIDIGARRIVISPPEGLLDVNERKS
jgi:16S rRNA processing protein RimM